MSRRRRALFAAVVVVTFFGAVEVAVRLATSALGRASIPEERITQHLEGSGLVYDEDLGWRSAERAWRHPEPLDPDADLLAIAIGDSQTVGVGLDLEDSWPLQTQAALRAARPDLRIQVLNAAVPGYSSLQALRLMTDEHLGALHPDLWLMDVRVFDSPRDSQVEPWGIDRLLFHWRTWYVMRFAIERARGTTASMRAVPDGRTDLGNHAGIMERAASRGEAVIFVDYPVWEHEQGVIGCHAMPPVLPPGAVVAPACEALQQQGQPASALFFDRNHMKAPACAAVGQAVARTVIEQDLLPAANP